MDAHTNSTHLMGFSTIPHADMSVFVSLSLRLPPSLSHTPSLCSCVCICLHGRLRRYVGVCYIRSIHAFTHGHNHDQTAEVSASLQQWFSPDGTLCLDSLFEAGDPDLEGASLGVAGRRKVFIELGCGDGEWVVAKAKRAQHGGRGEGRRGSGGQEAWVCVEVRRDRALEAWQAVCENRVAGKKTKMWAYVALFLCAAPNTLNLRA